MAAFIEALHVPWIWLSFPFYNICQFIPADGTYMDFVRHEL